MKRAGAPDHVIQAQLRLQEDTVFPVLQPNWPIVDFFFACRTQWRVGTIGAAGMAGTLLRPIYLGLDYAAVAVIAKVHRFKLDREAMLRLQLMEAAALNEMARAA